MSEKLTVIYNDTCPICSREVDAYKRSTTQDVGYVGWSEGKHHSYGLSDESAARAFHVVRGSERLEGVDAFVALWQRIPRLRWLARVVQLPGVHTLAKAGYRWAAAPLLYAMHKRRVRKAQCDR